MTTHFSLVTLDLDYTIFLGNSVLYLNKVLAISEKLIEYHADYRDGKVSEKELNTRQSSDPAEDQSRKILRGSSEGSDSEET